MKIIRKFYVKHRLLFEILSFLFSVLPIFLSLDSLLYEFPDFFNIDKDSDLMRMHFFSVNIGVSLCIFIYFVLDFIDSLFSFLKKLINKLKQKHINSKAI